MIFDIAVVGAGMAGLICARQLSQAGYSVVVLEKSRGVGGRLATRRVQGTRADHGTRYLETQGPMTQQFIEILRDCQILQLWSDRDYHLLADREIGSSYLPQYIAPTGMNSIGKFLAENLQIWLTCRVQGLTFSEGTWLLSLEATNESSSHPPQVQAQAVAIAIPAPQAATLLETIRQLPSPFVTQVQSVTFDPCIAVMAGYSPDREQELKTLNPAWKAIRFPSDSPIAWIGLDSSKRVDPQQPVFVVQSSAAFAEHYLESSNLQEVGEHLLVDAANQLMPWLQTPEWLQVHRWRYAFCRNPLPVSCLTTKEPLPIVCAGDWCGGNRIEGALQSGMAAACWIDDQLRQVPNLGEGFWQIFRTNPPAMPSENEKPGSQPE